MHASPFPELAKMVAIVSPLPQEKSIFSQSLKPERAPYDRTDVPLGMGLAAGRQYVLYIQFGPKLPKQCEKSSNKPPWQT
jgi:hypothetical protein